MTLTEYRGRKVRVRPDLLKLEPHILDSLTDAQRREGPDATIIEAEFASGQLFFDLDVDNVPKVQRKRLHPDRGQRAMTRAERQRREAIALLIAVRERNDGIVARLEDERLRLLARGRLFTSQRGGPHRVVHRQIARTRYERICPDA